MQSTQFNLNPVTQQYEFAHNEPEELAEDPAMEEGLGDEVGDEDGEVILPEKVDNHAYKAKDMELFHAWNSDKSKQNMSKLIKHLHPLIYSEVRRASGTLPTSALATEGKIWASKAIKSFDPDKGVALSTHVAGYIRKVRRMNSKYQLVARLPENKKNLYNPYKRAISNLTEEFGRDPTEDELAQHLGWTKGQVVDFGKRIYDASLESKSTYDKQFAEYSDKGLIMSELYSRLTPEENMILNLNKTMSSPELAKKLGVDVNGLNYKKRKLTQKIMDLKSELNYD